MLPLRVKYIAEEKNETIVEHSTDKFETTFHFMTHKSTVMRYLISGPI